MRVLLIVPRFVEKPGDFYEFPLGLCYISSSLKKAGFEVDGLNLNLTSGSVTDAVYAAVNGNGYDVVGTGGLSHHFTMIRSILAAAKVADSAVFTMAGGGLVSSEPELICAAMEMDAGIIGEGEITAVELVRTLDQGKSIENVAGIVYHHNGVCSITPSRPPIIDLDTIPWPDYELFDVRNYLDSQCPNDNYYTAIFDKPRVLPVISSRSCPYNCSFCYHPLGHKYRTRSISSVLEEIRYYQHEYQLNVISLLDELFSLDFERVEEFCTGMIDLDLKWIAQMRVDRVDKPLLKRMYDSGLYYISYGIESASQVILDSMRKQTCVGQIDRALDLTSKEKIGIQGNLLFGDPAETLETARESLKWMCQNMHYGLNMNYLIPYPGTSIYQSGFESKLIPDKLEYLETGCPQVNLTSMSQEDLLCIRDEIMYTQSENRFWAREAVATPINGDQDLALFHAICPHCGHRNLYRNFRVGNITVAKVACRNCMQRFDYKTSIFPKNAVLLQKMCDQAASFVGQKVRFCIAPSMSDSTFKDYLGFLGLSTGDLDIRFVFDNRSELQGRLQFGIIPIISTTSENIDLAIDDVFLILPCPNHESIVYDLMENCGVDEQQIIYLHQQPVG